MDVKNPAFFATCSRNLEELLENEIKEIAEKLDLKVNFTTHRKTVGGVSFETDDFSAIKILLHTRIASKIYKNIFKIWFDSEKEIPGICKKLPWEKYLQDNSYKFTLSLDRNLKSKFRSPSYLAQLINDGVKDRKKDSSITMKNSEVDFEQPDINFVVRLEQTKINYIAVIYADLCEFSLGHRGYRASGHIAPLRENLAAAIVMNTDWNPKEEEFIDSMCGTGTLLFEAYLIARDVTPSYLNIKEFIEKDALSYSFLNHHWFRVNKKLYNQVLPYLNELYFSNKEKLRADVGIPLKGYDLDVSALRVFEDCLKLANINPAHIKVEQADALRVSKANEESKGVIVCNPPYGERLNEVEELEELYYQYGENLKKSFKNFRAYILTSNPDLRKKISLKTSKRINMFNGPLECRLLEYKLY